MTRRLCGTLTFALLTVLVAILVAQAAPPPAFNSYGTVKINGENVPVGTAISAWCGGVQWNWTTAQSFEGQSVYVLDVPGDDPDTSTKDGCYAGETITYKVDDLWADQSATWSSGASVELNLTAFRPEPALTLEKRTNGQDADSGTGPYILTGGAVAWTYRITNTGNVTLTGISLSDNHLGSISCPKTKLVVDAGMTCTKNGTAQAGQYSNLGSVSGVYNSPVYGPMPASDTDPSHYFGATPGIDLEKRTNGQDADTAPGVYVEAGETVTWTYWVHNTGNVPLTVSVVDDSLGSVSCPQTELTAGAEMTCEVTGTAVSGQYDNLATATGTPPGGLADVSDGDPSHYFGAELAINVEKSTNGQDADTGPGPTIPIGEVVTWTYTITNDSNVALSPVALSDDQLGTVACSSTTLDAGEPMTCEVTGTAEAGYYTNTATVSGTPPGGLPAPSDQDVSHYFGADPRIEVQKRTNGQAADTPPGPTIIVGWPVTWTYEVSNPGNMPLSGIVITDSDPLVDVDCGEQTELAIGGSFTCSASDTAETGQYSNLATVTGNPPEGLPAVSDSDPSHYKGINPIIVLEKRTNGQDADQAPGPYIPVGEAVTWSYEVTNTGDVLLTSVKIVDDQQGTICIVGLLAQDDTATCTLGSVAAAGQYSNTATATAVPLGSTVTISDTDPSHYFGADLNLELEKQTNDQDADSPPGPLLLVGETVTWTYLITNSSNVTLTGVTLNDDDVLGPIGCGPSTLGPDEWTSCERTGSAEAGQYANLATVSGQPPGGLALAIGDDPSHYYGVSATLRLEKWTNGQDADAPPGPYVWANTPVTWTYLITNTGNVNLTGLTLGDDPQGVVSCPKTTLAAGEPMTCTLVGTAEVGAYSNTAAVTGTSPLATEATAADISHYYGISPSIQIQKYTNGEDADEPPGPKIWAEEQRANWTYVVTNSGDITLTQVGVTDDQGVTVDCPGDTLGPSESLECTASMTATVGLYANVGTASGLPPVGPPVSASDPSHYWGRIRAPAIGVQKLTNGQDANTGPGPLIPVGAAVSWDYVVTNLGNTDLLTVTVSDDQGVVVSCPGDGTLGQNQSVTCHASGFAEPGPYSNLATVTATAPAEPDVPPVVVSDTDPSHYYGSDPAIAVEKLTNGQDADSAPDSVYVLAGETVTWTYLVSNTGNVSLSGIKLVDDVEGTITCPKTALLAGKGMTCQRTGLAEEGPHANTAVVTGTPQVGQKVSASDPSHYFGTTLAVIFEKRTNGQDADSPPGPLVPVGDPVTWTYHLTSSSNVALSIALIDSEGVTIVCDPAELAPGGVVTCQAEAPGSASPGQYSNVATATLTPPEGLAPLVLVDASHYYGSDPGISLQKQTNGQDADQAPGPFVPVGEEVHWSYQVINTGNVSLSGIQLVDDVEGTITCPTTVLLPDEGMLCQEEGTFWAVAGQYANTGVVTGTPQVGQKVSASDPSHYFGSDPAIDLEKLTDGLDADSPPGLTGIYAGDPITWTYQVTNTGNVTLANITVTDSRGVAVDCPQSSLSPGLPMTCTANGTAVAGQYSNLGTARGTSPTGQEVMDTDPSHYYARTAEPALTLEKTTNGQDADAAPGPFLNVGTGLTVEWEYEVSNPGNVDLYNVRVTDDQGVTVDCDGQTYLPEGESMTCTASEAVQPGQYANQGTVTATWGSNVLSASDWSHYFGSVAGISLEKRTNGQDADTAPGVYLLVGQPVVWTYVVKNTGNYALTKVGVTDNQGVTVSCPKTSLGPDESMTCTAPADTATSGLYANQGTARGTPPTGGQISASDASHYTGIEPAISLEKYTNGEDADAPQGPIIQEGLDVEWTYVVSNTGDATLTDVTVVDDRGVAVSCSKSTLTPHTGMTCTASGVAEVGQYSNVGSVTATHPAGGTVGDSDASHYLGLRPAPAIDVQKLTNGKDADVPPGPYVLEGSSVTWEYLVTNAGNVGLQDVEVVDDKVTLSGCTRSSLAVGGSFTCYATDNEADAGQYDNLATASGTFNDESLLLGTVVVTDTDPSHYYGTVPGIKLQALTNGEDADAAPGVYIEAGDEVTWTYVVENSGNASLSSLTVVDDQGVTVSCPGSTLAAGLFMTCTATGVAEVGQYANTATVTGTPPAGDPLSASDESHYFGAELALDVEKSTNGHDADIGPGPTIPTGGAVTWNYTITNDSNVTLSGVTLQDDMLGLVVDCSRDTLDPGEEIPCEATGTAVAGTYANTATASGTPPGGLTPPSDQDASHYFGADPGIEVEKRTNGQSADSSPGPAIPVGDPVYWTYEVSNVGNMPLSGISVVDSDSSVAVDCGGQTDLAVGEAMTCEASSTAETGQYSNLATATGTPPEGLPDVSDSDPSHYYGVDAKVSIQVKTNGQDADSPPGPYIQVGQAVAWTYVVKNLSNTSLTGIGVVDDQGVTVSCPGDALAAGKQMTCSASGVAKAGQYANVGTVTASPPAGPDVQASDPSHYYGVDAEISIQVKTNGQDADGPPGPYVQVGQAVNWTYVVKNLSNSALAGIGVVDDQGVTVSCPGDALAAGKQMTCSASGAAQAGQYANVGTVTASPPVGPKVQASDPSHYYGVDAEISIQVYTNGQDADSPPGPYIAVGEAVNWTYVVKNLSNSALAGIGVVDDQGVTVSCPGDALAAGKQMTCSASGVAKAGQYANVGTVTASPPVGPKVQASDPSHYFGEASGFEVYLPVVLRLTP